MPVHSGQSLGVGEMFEKEGHAQVAKPAGDGICHFGLNATDWKCYELLTQAGSIPAGELAELSGLTTGAITGVVDRLEQADFAMRRRDPNDRRRVIIQEEIARLRQESQWQS